MSEGNPPVPNQSSPRTMGNFTVLWVGQVFSLIGSAITGFAVGIWAWEETGLATPLALVGVFSVIPMLLLTPPAGVIVDKWPRKLVLAFSDIFSGLGTLFVLVMYLAGQLQIWHIYLAAAMVGIGAAFQWPAYSAAISVMLPKQHYARANGMISMADSGAGILAPTLAAALYAGLGLKGILVLDLAALALALALLVVARIPSREPQPESGPVESFLRQMTFGFRYIWERKPLLGVQTTFLFINLFFGISGAIMVPMLMSRTNNNVTLLGTIQSISGIGALLGSLFITVWGGAKRKVPTVLTGFILSSLFSGVLFGLANQGWMWASVGFASMFILQVLNASNQALWQAKVDPALQGRVFSVRRLIAQGSAPLSMAIAGPLADQIFEPGIQQAGSLIARVFGPLVGTGKGSGMAAIFIITGVLGVLAGLAGWLIRPVREADTLLPDHEPEGISTGD